MNRFSLKGLKILKLLKDVLVCREYGKKSTLWQTLKTLFLMCSLEAERLLIS